MAFVGVASVLVEPGAVLCLMMLRPLLTLSGFPKCPVLGLFQLTTESCQVEPFFKFTWASCTVIC